jgi:hypothetical protein
MIENVQNKGLARVLTDIIGERKAQDEQWGGSHHDDHHGLLEWAGLIEHHLGRLAKELVPGPLSSTREAVRRNNGAVRRRMLVITTLGAAALESIDRRIEQLEAGWADEDAGAIERVDDHD